MKLVVVTLLACCGGALMFWLGTAHRPAPPPLQAAQRAGGEGDQVFELTRNNGEQAHREAALQAPSTMEPVEAQEPGPRATLDGSAVDQAGVSDEHRLQCLIKSHDLMLRVCSSPKQPERTKALAESAFARECAIAILHASGRAEFDPAPDGKFHWGAVTEDEHLIGADRAQYHFMRGEFPVYDVALDRSRRLGPRADGISMERPLDFDEQLERLYDQALASFSVTKAKQKKE